MWGAIIDRVLRRPVLSVVLAGGLLLGIAAPAVQLTTVQPGLDTYPQSLLTTYNRLEAAFPAPRSRRRSLSMPPTSSRPRYRLRSKR